MINPFQQMQNMIQSFQQFKQGFTGNASQQIQRMLNSGRVTQPQYNQAVQMAQQFSRMFGK